MIFRYLLLLYFIHIKNTFYISPFLSFVFTTSLGTIAYTMPLSSIVQCYVNCTAALIMRLKWFTATKFADNKIRSNKQMQIVDLYFWIIKMPNIQKMFRNYYDKQNIVFDDTMYRP